MKTIVSIVYLLYIFYKIYEEERRGSDEIGVYFKILLNLNNGALDAPCKDYFTGNEGNKLRLNIYFMSNDCV